LDSLLKKYAFDKGVKLTSSFGIDNLGIGDLWDIESGIDFLVEKGFIDEKKVGCMGWSQGGYISAFATTHSEKFAAISVGAGISSWYTYHIGTDIRQFTQHYLSSLPHENMPIYEKTSAMVKIFRRRSKSNHLKTSKV